ncbi:BtaA family protein [Trichocoleus desertorum AS-A10]|uniref:DUF3419 family protein n=1 Tax=Trichocoleus desertorum TaxID=1481672 RepID=UPI0032981AF7
MPICCPPSEIAFSQVREDPLTEWQLVERLAKQQGHPLRILLVASGGCTALSLLAHPAIAQIDAVDLNPAQLHLVTLKLTALLHLSLPEQWRLLGAASDSLQFSNTAGISEPEAEAGDRLQRYQRLQTHLPEAIRLFWDARLDQIAFGVNRIGRFEQLFRELATRFAELGIDPLHNPQAAMAHPHWSAVFAAVFERDKLMETFGPAAVSYSMDRSFSEHFADVFAQALQQFAPDQNYFLTQVWRDRYTAGLDGVPPYLQAAVQEVIRQLGTSRLALHLGPFTEVLLRLVQQDAYDLIQFSNISDWMPISDLHQMLATGAASLRPGGILLGRRLNGDHDLAAMMAEHVAVDRQLSAELLASDRSYFYREVVAGVRL